MDRYEGRCRCERVRFTLEGPPMQAMYCHCSVCRRSNSAPFIMVGFWDPTKMHLETGAPLLEQATSSYLTRNRCPDCGSPIFNAVRSEKITSNNVMLPLLLQRDEATRPTHHIYYADRIVDVEDGLPKFDRFKWLQPVGAG